MEGCGEVAARDGVTDFLGAESGGAFAEDVKTGGVWEVEVGFTFFEGLLYKVLVEIGKDGVRCQVDLELRFVVLGVK